MVDKKKTELNRLMNDSNMSFHRARSAGKLPTGSGRTVWFTEGEFETLRTAIRAVRIIEDDPNIREGRAVELCCLDFLSGVGNYEKDNQREG